MQGHCHRTTNACIVDPTSLDREVALLQCASIRSGRKFCWHPRAERKQKKSQKFSAAPKSNTFGLCLRKTWKRLRKRRKQRSPSFDEKTNLPVQFDVKFATTRMKLQLRSNLLLMILSKRNARCRNGVLATKKAGEKHRKNRKNPEENVLEVPELSGARDLQADQGTRDSSCEAQNTSPHHRNTLSAIRADGAC